MSFFEKGEFKLLWRLYVGSFITSAFYFIPAFGLVYLISIGLSLTNAGLLFGAMSLATIIFEIPTGAVADKYGRKFSVVLGGVLETILILSIFFTTSFYILFLLFFLLGAVGTLHSGAGESWIYDLIIKKDKKILRGYYSKIQLFGSLGFVLSGIFGALVVSQFGLKYVWIFSGLAMFAYILIISKIPEIYTTKKEHKEKFKEIWRQSTDSVKYAINHHVLLYIFLASFIVIFSASFAEGLAFVPYLQSLGFPDYAFGYFFSGIALVSAMAPMATKYIKSKNREGLLLASLVIVGSLTLSFTYFAKNYFIALAFILLSFFIFSMKYPIERPFMQKFIPTKMRATVLSAQSMVYSLAGVIALPVGGFLIDKFGALNVILISAFLGIPTAWAYWMIKKKK